jgi:hypothetical protein
MLSFFQSFDAVAARPEIMLSVFAAMILMVGVFVKKNAYGLVMALSSGALALTILALWFMSPHTKEIAFGGAFVNDTFARSMKTLALLGSLMALLLADRFMQVRENMAKFEYPILILFASIGMMLMISANNLISLYMGLELQSLSLYVVAAIDRDNAKSSSSEHSHPACCFTAHHWFMVSPARQNSSASPKPCKSQAPASASFSASSSSLQALLSKCPPFHSTCGHRMFMKVPQPPSQLSLPQHQRSPPWRSSCVS